MHVLVTILSNNWGTEQLELCPDCWKVCEDNLNHTTCNYIVDELVDVQDSTCDECAWKPFYQQEEICESI